MSPTRASSAQLENLPSEVLYRICVHLGDVLAFRLVSKQCLAAANTVFYSSIVVHFSKPDALAKDIAQWHRRLNEAHGLQHPRYLQLKNAIPEPLWAGEFPDQVDEQLVQRWQRLHDYRQVAPGDEQDREWQVVAEFIQSLPGLVEVHYACWPQLAPCVLTAIEMKPGCKLFHHTFALRSLWQPPSQPIRVDPYELKLATSPSLHSVITTKFQRLDDHGHVNYLEQAIMTLASGLAPNLESISLCYWIGPISPATVTAGRVTPPTWQGTEFGSKRVSGSKNSLRSLELNHKAICKLEKLESWAASTDFSRLTSLKIRHNVGTKIMRWLSSSEVQLNALHTLVLGLEAYQDGNNRRNIVLYEEEAELMRLFVDLSKRLLSLRTFRVTGDCNYTTLRQFLEFHSTTLEQLAVFVDPRTPQLSRDNILTKENWACVALKDLSLPLDRRGGDAEEVRFYKWMGANFPNLRRLFLSVDCSYAGPVIDENAPGQDSPAIFRRFDDKLYDMRFVLRNYAIDEVVIESIFRTISDAKTPGSPALERLELKIFAGVADNYVRDFLKLCMTVLARNWVCSQRDMYNQTKQLVFEQSPVSTNGEFSASQDIDAKAVEVFHLVWPEKPDKNWRECWHGFPLFT